jgi:hypothetical protein
MTSKKFYDDPVDYTNKNKENYATYIRDKIVKEEINLNDTHILPYNTKNKDVLKEITNIFTIIKENYEKNKTDGNQNTLFKEYLCEVIKNKDKPNIFNTYYYIPSPFWGVPEGFIPFFVLLTFRFKGTGGSDLNSKYFQDKPPDNGETFEHHFNAIIHLFKEIFQNPTTKINDDCTYQDIIDFILKNNLIHIDSLTQENPTKYDPMFAPFPWAIYNNNKNFIDLFKIIIERGPSDTESHTENTETDTENTETDTENTETDTETESFDSTQETVPGVVSLLHSIPNKRNKTVHIGRRRGRKGGKSTRKAKHTNAKKTRRQSKQNRKTKRQRK